MESQRLYVSKAQNGSDCIERILRVEISYSEMFVLYFYSTITRFNHSHAMFYALLGKDNTEESLQGQLISSINGPFHVKELFNHFWFNSPRCQLLAFDQTGLHQLMCLILLPKLALVNSKC